MYSIEAYILCEDIFLCMDCVCVCLNETGCVILVAYWCYLPTFQLSEHLCGFVYTCVFLQVCVNFCVCVCVCVYVCKQKGSRAYIDSTTH